MKNLLTSFFLLIAIVSQAQFGFHAGANTSWFGGPGDNHYTGTKYNSQGLIAGFQDKVHFRYTNFFIQPEISWIHQGARNPNEGMRNFSTYGTLVSVMAGYNIHDFTIQAGGGYNKLFYARNNSVYGSTFGWSAKHWDYYTGHDWELKAAVSYDFIGFIGQITYLYGLTNVRTGGNGKPSYNDPKMYGNENRGIAVIAYIPFADRSWKKPDRKPHLIKESN